MHPLVDVPLNTRPVIQEPAKPPFTFYPQVYTRKKKQIDPSTATHGPMPAGSTSGNPPPSRSFTSNLSLIHIPSSYHEALTHAGWLAAMKAEMAALHSNKT